MSIQFYYFSIFLSKSTIISFYSYNSQYPYTNLFQFSSLNPINIPLPHINNGLFIRILSLANNSIFSLSFIVTLYFNPLVLKHFLISIPLIFIHSVNSSIVGVSSTIFISIYLMLFSSNHFLAFLHVEHFEYYINIFFIFFTE